MAISESSKVAEFPILLPDGQEIVVRFLFQERRQTRDGMASWYAMCVPKSLFGKATICSGQEPEHVWRRPAAFLTLHPKGLRQDENAYEIQLSAQRGFLAGIVIGRRTPVAIFQFNETILAWSRIV